MASFLEARTHGGRWLVRVEDIDPPRAQAGATEQILYALEVYGFEWDGPVTYQSASRKQHDEALQQLLSDNFAYPCGCSRRSYAQTYPGTCRNGTQAVETALRVRTNDDPLEFNDALQGLQSHQLESESGDFVVLRKDGLIAYQLAVVVDDYLQGITDIVRGIDLMDSTPRQIWLQQLLGYPSPAYAHIPVAVNDKDQKLSKSHGAAAISCEDAAQTLIRALEMLQQQPSAELLDGSIEEIWGWAIGHWDMTKLQGETQFLSDQKLYQPTNSICTKIP